MTNKQFIKTPLIDQQFYKLHSEVHLWSFSLCQPDGLINQLYDTLASDEIARIERLRFMSDRVKSIVARGVLRTVIGTYTGIEPRKLKFRYGTAGKPKLDFPGQIMLEFNLSHSWERGMLALTRGRCLGIDIEYIDEHIDHDELATRFFSATEARLLRQLAPNRRKIAFYHTWVQKEAYVKALGQGLNISLDAFSVSVAPDDGAQLTHVSTEIEAEYARWQIYRLGVPHGYVGALAVEGMDLELQYFDWPSL